jgi:hypothetical protein
VQQQLARGVGREEGETHRATHGRRQEGPSARSRGDRAQGEAQRDAEGHGSREAQRRQQPETGKYTAPDTMPQGGDTFEVIVRSMEDPTITKRVTIRLINPAKKE